MLSHAGVVLPQRWPGSLPECHPAVGACISCSEPGRVQACSHYAWYAAPRPLQADEDAQGQVRQLALGTSQPHRVVPAALTVPVCAHHAARIPCSIPSMLARTLSKTAQPHRALLAAVPTLPGTADVCTHRCAQQQPTQPQPLQPLVAAAAAAAGGGQQRHTRLNPTSAQGARARALLPGHCYKGPLPSPPLP
jgi:hypothetical protein